MGTKLIRFMKVNRPDYEFHEYTGSIENLSELREAFSKNIWDFVIHFAAISHVSDCENDPQKAFQVNTLGSVHLAHLIADSGFSGLLIFASTSFIFEYNSASEKIEITEASKERPKNVYSRSKHFAEVVFKALSEYTNCSVCVLRLFNHTHISQSPKFFLPSVYQQILKAKDGDEIRVGNLDIERDFSLISDFNRFVMNALESKRRLKFEIVNLSSGRVRNLRVLVVKLIQRSGKNLKIVQDSALFRSNDPRSILGKFKTSYNNNLSDDQFIDEFIKDDVV